MTLIVRGLIVFISDQCGAWKTYARYSPRKRLNLSQEELATRAEIDRTYISGIERKVRNPTITVGAKLAEALETTTADLLTVPTE